MNRVFDASLGLHNTVIVDESLLMPLFFSSALL